MNLLVALFVVAILIILYKWWQSSLIVSMQSLDGRKYIVSTKFANSKEAANLLSRANTDIVTLLAHLKSQIPPSDDYDKRVSVMLDRYDPDEIIENVPSVISRDTSYTIDKGKQTYICVRDKSNPILLVDYNTLLFVMLHELSHIASYDVIGHPPRFWTVFKWILNEAVKIGIYKPVDYEKKPVMYCGLLIDYNPYFDDTLFAAV